MASPLAALLVLLLLGCGISCAGGTPLAPQDDPYVVTTPTGPVNCRPGQLRLGLERTPAGSDYEPPRPQLVQKLQRIVRRGLVIYMQGDSTMLVQFNHLRWLMGLARDPGTPGPPDEPDVTLIKERRNLRVYSTAIDPEFCTGDTPTWVENIHVTIGGHKLTAVGVFCVVGLLDASTLVPNVQALLQPPHRFEELRTLDMVYFNTGGAHFRNVDGDWLAKELLHGNATRERLHRALYDIQKTFPKAHRTMQSTGVDGCFACADKPVCCELTAKQRTYDYSTEGIMDSMWSIERDLLREYPSFRVVDAHELNSGLCACTVDGTHYVDNTADAACVSQSLELERAFDALEPATPG